MAVDLCNVGGKMKCIYKPIIIKNTSSNKRFDQSYKVMASNELRPEAELALSSASTVATEKIDGTCVKIDLYQGMPWLWARHDRKPNKVAEKRFKKYRALNPACTLDDDDDGAVKFKWSIEQDFKDVPNDWVPAVDPCGDGDGLQPDPNGHIPGWVPIDPHSRQHCWHLSVCNLNQGECLVLQPQLSEQGDLSGLNLTTQRMCDVLGCTFELIGTCINANPYHIGSKDNPLHFLVRHGSISLNPPHAGCQADLRRWFDNEGAVEGIVWHSPGTGDMTGGGGMFKIHRHHLGLEWPLVSPPPRLTTLPVRVRVGVKEGGMECENGVGLIGKGLESDTGEGLIERMSNISRQTFESLQSLNF